MGGPQRYGSDTASPDLALPQGTPTQFVDVAALSQSSARSIDSLAASQEGGQS